MPAPAEPHARPTETAIATADGSPLPAWVLGPEEGPRGGLVILPEVFGLNDDIRAVMRSYAADGYLALAPNILARGGAPSVDLPYSREGMAAANRLWEALSDDQVIADIAAAAAHIRSILGRDARVAGLGFCRGGWLVWRAAAALDPDGPRHLDGAIVYYGNRVHKYREEAPRCPAICHFGDQDPYIPVASVEEIRATRPEVSVHLYEGAGHGFNTEASKGYHPASAALARQRNAAFLATRIG